MNVTITVRDGARDVSVDFDIKPGEELTADDASIDYLWRRYLVAAFARIRDELSTAMS